ncbi:MAG: EamA family transporter [Gemmatimonadota bacterium]
MLGTTRHPTQVEASGPSTVQIVLAFAAVYVIWGSTYLAIRFAIETMPPFVMAALRFLIAGVALYAWARWAGAPRPTRRQWIGASVTGTLLLVGGNGAVVVAEQWVPSGLVALIVATVPLWLVLLDWAFGSGLRPSARTSWGLLIGFAGVAVLGGSEGLGAGGAREELFGGLLVVVGSLCWAAGSLVSRYLPEPPRPRMLVAMQFLTGGLVFVLIAVPFGDWAAFDVREVSVRSSLALLYLIVFGAWIGYGAYIWLLTVVTPARAGTYAYVNPVVAMFLGWALADEPLTFRSAVAAAIILGSVVMITSDPARSGSGVARRPSPAARED